MKTPPQQATGYQKEDDPEPTRSKLRGIAPKEIEADRLMGFTQFFSHSGTKEVRSREVLRPLLLLDLFAEGTNTGINPTTSL